jgi:hypothetical protein
MSMSDRLYTLLGWAVWQGAKIKLRQNKGKIGAAATVVGVLAVGLAVVKAASGDDS